MLGKIKSDSLFGDADNLGYGARLKLSRKRRSKDRIECYGSCPPVKLG